MHPSYTAFSYLGMAMALSASVLWSLSPVLFASAGRRIGSHRVNLVRLALAALMLWVPLPLYVRLSHCGFPGLAPSLFLALSALLGLVVGDAFYLRALVHIGPRRTMQLLTLSPLVSISAGWFYLGERMGPRMLAGTAMIVAGILTAAIYERNPQHADHREPGVFSAWGYLLAMTGTICHGLGAVFARRAFLEAPAMDTYVATAVRVGSAALIIWTAQALTRRTRVTFSDLKVPGVALALAGGTLAGPVIGMVCYISAFKYASAGVVSILSSLSPVLVIPIVALRYKSHISPAAVAGTIIAVAGVVVMGWT